MKGRQWIATLAIVGVGIVAAFFIMRSPAPEADTHGQNEEQAAHSDELPRKGPHGGRLLAEGPFSVEVTIFETGVPPEFRVHAYENGKPVDPAGVKLAIELTRLGAKPELVNFKPQEGYLRGDREIEGQHSFDVALVAERGGKTYRWAYEQAEGRVTMDDATAANSGIEIATAGPATIVSTLALQGEIQFDQDRVAHVIPRLSGVVVRSAKNLGDTVKKGDLLAVVESQALADLKSDYLAAQTRLQLAQSTFDREKRLWEDKISPQQDYLASRTALAEAEITHRTVAQKLLALGLSRASVNQPSREALTRFEIRAPIDGVVIEKHLAVGEAVGADSTIFVIADLSSVWAEMTVYPKDLAAVKLGQKVTVKASALNAEATGTISYVGSLVGEQTRSAKARVTLKNPEQSWRPGLFVTIDVVQGEAEVPVAVSVDALQTLGAAQVVFFRSGDLFEARPVELGRSDGNRVEVVNGLAAGDRYAATNSFVLKAELGKAGASHAH
jgi:cobalt-zinc-cadmium efflux system membrane fusion protein